MRPTRATGPALGLSAVLLVGACGADDGSSAAADTDATASETPSETTSESTSDDTGAPSVSVDPVDFGTEPEVRTPYKRAALRAVGDDLITMVPTVLPDGWRSSGGGYTADPQWWRMEFTAPSGDVVLDQLPGTAADVLADAADLTEADPVDLSDWGTGEWSAWDHDGASVLAYDLKGSTVVLQGQDLDSVRALAETLLPAEDAPTQDG